MALDVGLKRRSRHRRRLLLLPRPSRHHLRHPRLSRRLRRRHRRQELSDRRTYARHVAAATSRAGELAARVAAAVEEGEMSGDQALETQARLDALMARVDAAAKTVKRTTDKEII